MRIVPVDWEMSGRPEDLEWALGADLHANGMNGCNSLCHEWAQKAYRRAQPQVLAAERRATVERIRERYNQLPQGQYRLMAIYDLLDEERDR